MVQNYIEEKRYRSIYISLQCIYGGFVPGELHGDNLEEE